MTFVTANIRDNLVRDSMERSAAYLIAGVAAMTLNRALRPGGIARATTAAKVKTVNTVPYTVGGKFFSKAATDNFWTLAGDVVAVSSFQKYALCIDTAGAASIVQATPNVESAAAVSWANVNQMSKWSPLITILNNDGGVARAIVGILTIATDSTHPFTPGTTALNATGITATFLDGIGPALLPLIGNPFASIIGLDS